MRVYSERISPVELDLEIPFHVSRITTTLVFVFYIMLNANLDWPVHCVLTYCVCNLEYMTRHWVDRKSQDSYYENSDTSRLLVSILASILHPLRWPYTVSSSMTRDTAIILSELSENYFHFQPLFSTGFRRMKTEFLGEGDTLYIFKSLASLL